MKVAVLVMIWGVFLAIGVFRLDPDFGWHVKMGEYIEKYGIPAKDPFTYTMPNFDFIDHEWLTNVLMGWGYRVMGKTGLAVVFAAMTVAVIGLAMGGEKRWTTVPILLGSVLLFNRGGVRPQVVDWLFLAMIVRWYESREGWTKWRWLFPVLMGVWANLHGGFAMGLAVMLFVIGVRVITERKVEWRDAVAWGLGLVGTWVNPYGPRIWREVAMQMTDANLRWTIAEWQPFFVTVEPAFWMLAVFCFMGMWRYRDKVVKWKAGVAAGLGVAGLSSLRHVALFVVVAMRELRWVFGRMWEEAGGVAGGQRRMRKFYGILVGVAAGLWLWEVGWALTAMKQAGWNSEKGFPTYPTQAVQWLKNNKPEGQVFSEYGWGGYLIWKYPEKKVFIDGRGPSWRWTSPDHRYADWVFKEYLRVTQEGEWKEVFDKYGVKTVLWPVERRNPYLEAINSWMARWRWRLGGGKKEEKPGLVESLAEAGWKKLYEDEVAVVYSKP